jgi:hypothetical protein
MKLSRTLKKDVLSLPWTDAPMSPIRMPGFRWTSLAGETVHPSCTTRDRCNDSSLKCRLVRVACEFATTQFGTVRLSQRNRRTTGAGR